MNIKNTIRLLLASLLLCLASASHAANWIKKIRSNSLENKLQIIIDTENNADYKVFVLSNPIRLVLDVRGRPVVDFSNNLNFKNRGVNKVRTGMSEDDKVRIVLDLIKDFRWKVYELKPDNQHGHRVVVDVFDYPKTLGKATQLQKPMAKKADVKTGITVSNQQLVLESLNGGNDVPITAIAKTPKFEPVIKEAADILPEKNTAKVPVVGAMPAPKTPKEAAAILPQKNTAKAPVVSAMPAPKTPKEASQPSDTSLATTAPLEMQFTPNKPAAVVATTPAPRPPSHKKLLVMIDPGHGGKDPGAIGQGGTREKHVVLQIAKRLEARINRTSGMRAILTRRTDRYITLRGRLALANTHSPDIFVSIHADAAENRSASGSSVFILSNSGASSKTAKWIAKRENEVDSKYGSDLGDFSSDVSNVLLGMQQDITIESSHAVANQTLKRLKGIGLVHKRRVERAGFAVLKYPSIPSMLVETAFLSNPNEERKLRKKSYQDEIANAIASGIEAYFRAQGKL